MKDIAIIGAGGLGREILGLIESINQVVPAYKVIGFFDDGIAKGSLIHALPVLGGIEEMLNYDKELCLVMGIAAPNIKKKIIEKVSSKQNFSFPTLIHPRALIQDTNSVLIGEGVVIAAGTIITCDVELGNFTFLNLNCTVGHDAKIGAFSSFMPTVNISGETNLGEGVYVGTGASIINRVDIGTYSIIGAGATVTSTIPEYCTAVGTPAKVIKQNNRGGGIKS